MGEKSDGLAQFYIGSALGCIFVCILRLIFH